MELHVLFRKAEPLTVDAWQHAMAELNLPATLPADFTIESPSGFAPVSFRGEAAGFEFYRTTATADLLQEAGLALGTYDEAATFLWGGNLKEMGAAVCAGAALASLTGGVLYFPQDGDVLDGGEAVAWAMEAVDAV